MKSYHFIAVVLFFMFIGVSSGHAQQTAEQLYQSALYKEEIEGQLDAAIKIYETIIKQYPDNRSVAAKTQLHIGLCYEKLGNAEARKAYERVLRDYADQAEPTKLARERLSALTVGEGKTTGSAELALRRIWVSGQNQFVGISRDGRYVILNLPESGDLGLRDLQTDEQRQITHEASQVDWTGVNGPATISPDGKQITYCWQNKANLELRLSAIDGSSMRVLHNGQDGRSLIASNWMPDGRSILVVSDDIKDQTFRLQMISLSDNTIRNVGLPDREYIGWVSPSPDGRQIAYSRNNDIYIYDVATEKESVFVQNPANDAVAGWTPDGTGIVFFSNRSGTHDLYLLGIENGKPRGDLKLLRQDFGANTGGFLTRDGRLFRVEVTLTFDSFIVQVDEKTGKPAGIPDQIDPEFSMITNPMWSSDGKLLYYLRTKGLQSWGEGVLVVRSEETGEIREIILKSNLKWSDSPLMSPDGSQFVVTLTDGKMYIDVFTVNSRSGEVSQITKIPASTVSGIVSPCPNWSPDGKAIFYQVRSPEKNEEFIIHRKDLTSGEDKEIYRGIHAMGMKISPDGTRFVYFRNDSLTKSYVLGILDIKSGKELMLWQVPEADTPGGISDPNWMPDGKYILVKRNLNQGSELWRLPAAGGPGEKLHFFPEGVSGFVLNPSGDRMAFTRYQMSYELWVLENFLPK